MTDITIWHIKGFSMMSDAITIDKLLHKPLDTLLAAFFNTSQNTNGNFEIQSSYRQTKFLLLPDDTYKKTTAQLSKKYGLEFHPSNATTIVADIINDKHWSLDEFLNAVYEAILPKLNTLRAKDSLDAEIALAMFIFRGSADFNRGLYAVDLKNPTPKYVDNIFKLLLSSDELLDRLNLNFRELQPQFVAGTNLRNTQIRINLKWFFDNVISKFDKINQYKTNVLQSQRMNLGEIKKSNSFEDRLVFYQESVLNRELTPREINELRQDLDFNVHMLQETDNVFGLRNQKIVSYARETFEDVCVGCGDIYDIRDRSFKMPRNDRYYFEINHVIAYASDSHAVDVLDNLVKLCPTCHRALTPGRAYPDYQKTIIDKMLRSRPEVSNFVHSMMPEHLNSPVDFVYESLR
ncbi:MAG: HNH endonuclease [Rickettsiales bacterium]|jgi:5-methylcytosine-specific restriction protein A|nr:HNH endonuclease [Rickettsiales bacterium]